MLTDPHNQSSKTYFDLRVTKRWILVDKGDVNRKMLGTNGLSRHTQYYNDCIVNNLFHNSR